MEDHPKIYFLPLILFSLFKKAVKVSIPENLFNAEIKQKATTPIYSSLISLTNELAVNSILDLLKNIEAFLLLRECSDQDW